MGIKIKKPPFLKIEKAYRLCTALSFYCVFAVILSAVVVVPVFGSAKWVLVMYSGCYYVYAVAVVACATLGAIACAKTQSETLGLQAVLHLVDFILLALNYKLFTALALFGLGLDSKADSFVGNDTDAFVAQCTEQWLYLILAVLIACVMAVLATLKLKKYKA